VPKEPLRAKPTRREFVTAVGAGAAIISSPNLLLAQKTDRKNPIVGDGEHRYECNHAWGELPTGHNYGGASHGTAVDKEGLIYIAHQGSPASIFVFEPSGKFVRALGEKFTGNGHGIDIREEDGEEFLYLSPSKPNLGFAKMNLKGELVWEKTREMISADSGLYKDPKARFRSTNINFGPDGQYYLGDGYGSGYIHRYDKDNKWVSSFGGSGTEDGKFKTPHGQWLDDREETPMIAVCDRANKRLQWFDLDGKHLKTLGGFLFPADIDIQGDIMLVPDLHCRITLLDKENKVITHLGDDEAWRTVALAGFKMRRTPEKCPPGKFIHPHDACFDKAGNIFVAEWVAGGRISKLTKVN